MQNEKEMLNLYRWFIGILLGVVGFVTAATYATVIKNNENTTSLTTTMSVVTDDIKELQNEMQVLQDQLNYDRGRNDQRENERRRKEDVLREETMNLIGQTEENILQAHRIMKLGSADSLLN